MIGVPPTAGFLGKWFILLAAVQIEEWFAVVVIVLSTLLTAGYFLPILYKAFARGSKQEGDDRIGESPWPMVASLVVTAVVTVLLFVWPGAPFELAEMLAGNATIDAGGSGVVEFPPEGGNP
jgi:multicomponent Na+:H+ antiporter subunit D